MSHWIEPDDMSSQRRMREIAKLLAKGVLRLRSEENSPKLSTPALIDVATCRSVCETVDDGEIER